MADNIRNTIYDDVMYREDVKNEFLSKYPEDTQRTYKRIFLKSYMLESMWGKDLCDFNQEEVEQLLTALSPLTIAASKANLSTVNSYINWCIPNYTSRQTNISPLEFLKSNKDFIKKFVDESIQLFISKQELDVISSQLINPQDSAIIQALFNGITVQQLQHMKKTDINDDNTVFLRDDDGEFIKDNDTGEISKLPVSEDCINHLQKAAESKFYHVKNGEPSENSKIDTVELAENDYVFRVSKTRNKSPLEPIAYHVISRRVKEISKFISNPYLTPKNIFKSGYVYEGYKLWVEAGKPNLENGKLPTEMYHTICRKFNFPKTNSGTYYTVSLRDYINISTFNELYEE